MTDITDNEKRVLREWAEKNKLRDEETHLAARYILATVDAPATTLSEDLAHIIEFWESWATDVITGALTAAATHAEQMERDLAEARAEVERLTDERLDRNPKAKARVEAALNNLDQTEKVTVPMPMPPGDIPGTALPINISAIVPDPTTPNPADVKEEEPYHIYYGVYGNDHTIGVRIDGKWRCIGDDRGVHVTDTNIASLTRLVPAPRVITNPDELEELRNRSIVLDGADRVCIKNSLGLFSRSDSGWITTKQCLDHGPVTVLWEPGA